MTNVPEMNLAMEAGICYASVAMVTDFDCWNEDHGNVTVEEIIATMNQNSANAQKVFVETVKQFAGSSDMWHRLPCRGGVRVDNKARQCRTVGRRETQARWDLQIKAVN